MLASIFKHNVTIRIAYQGLFFFNSTLLYSFAVRETSSRNLLFFSAFIAALSLTVNLAVQLSATQFQSAGWILKIASAAMLIWMCLSTGISPPLIALSIGVSAIVLTHREALVGSPSPLAITLTVLPIAITSIFLALARTDIAKRYEDSVLLLLILPYLLTAVVNRPKSYKIESREVSIGRLKVAILIVSQLLPTASAFVMLKYVSFVTDTVAVATFILMERAIAIGGSLIYFYARVNGALPRLATSFIAILLLIAAAIILSTILAFPTWIIVATYTSAGALLSYGTISLGAKNARGILAINGMALIALLLTVENLTEIQPIRLLFVYVFPQLILMGVLIAFTAYKND